MTLSNLINKAVESFDKKFVNGKNNGIYTCEDENRILVDDWKREFLPEEIKSFLTKCIQESYEEGIKDTVSTFKEVFDDWAVDSQYVTGAWNSGEYLDSDRKGDDYWNWWCKPAWEQYYDKLKSKLQSLTNKSKEENK